MSMSKLARAASDAAISRVTWGGSQNFLGARWVGWAVAHVPPPARQQVALRFLSLSPHYFYGRDLAAEAARNRQSRQLIADNLIVPHLTPGARVLDYGCGPGYLAAAVAPQAGQVHAVDISRGVLACARVLNGLPNIAYQTPGEFRAAATQVDLAYSFAVVQHLRSDALVAALGLLADAVRPGGLLLLHFAVSGEQDYRTEGQWLADESVSGRARLRYGLNCFGRPAAELTDLVTRSGFSDVTARPLGGMAAIPGDDIADQHLLIARRATAAVQEMTSVTQRICLYSPSDHRREPRGPVTANTLAGQLQEARAVLRTRHLGGAVARTACFNTATAACAALSGVIVARTVGPAVRGEYAAVIAWFGILLVTGEIGQSAAVCFYVARDPRRARGYVATSRAMLTLTGAIALAGGLALAPVLAHGNAQLAGAYRLAFSGSVLAFIGTSYTFSLQARSTGRWNLVRVSQPLLALAAVITLRVCGLLTLDTAIGAMLLTMAVQLGYAYYWCRRTGLAPGRVRLALAAPLARYGLAQLAAVTPTTVNNYLDQLVLSQLVSPADLGRYAIAASVTMVPVPLVSAIGNVAFPRLAARRAAVGDERRMALAAAASAGMAAAILVPIAGSAYWLIPAVFGSGYRGSVPLVWILTPGGIFLACGQVTGDLLRGLNRPGLVAAAQGLAAIGTVTLLIVLLPSTGVAAAAIASTVAYGTALAVMIHWLRHPPRARQTPAS